MKKTGRKPLTEEERKAAAEGSVEKPKWTYPSVYTDTKDMPIDLAGMGVKAGDKLYFCGVINISEIRPIDREGVTEPEPTGFTMEILEFGVKPMDKTDDTYKAASSDNSLNSAVAAPPSRLYP